MSEKETIRASETPQAEEPFKNPSVYLVDKVNRLQKESRTALKRAVGKPMAEAGSKAIEVFYRCMPYNVPKWHEERYFAVACIQCLWDKTTESATKNTIEDVIGYLTRSEETSDSFVHRVESVLDTSWGEDGFLLSKLSRLMVYVHSKAEHANIDFAALLNDLLYWNAETQSVQRKWLRSMFYGRYNNEETEN